MAQTNQSSQQVPTALKIIRRIVRIASTFSPKLAGFIVYQLFSTTVKRHKAKLDHNPHIINITHKGRNIVGYEWGGTGRRILLVHGWESSAARFRKLIDLLIEQDYHVFAMDAPAHGASEGRQTTPLDYADALHAFIESVGGVELVIAHSFGTVATMNLLRAYPETDIEKIVLIGALNSPQQAVEFFSEVFELTQETADYMAYFMVKYVGFSFEEVSSVHIAKSQTRHALILHDVEDDVVPVSSGRAIAAAWNGAHYIETQGLGHRRILNDTTVLNQILDFITETEQMPVASPVV